MHYRGKIKLHIFWKQFPIPFGAVFPTIPNNLRSSVGVIDNPHIFKDYINIIMPSSLNGNALTALDRLQSVACLRHSIIFFVVVASCAILKIPGTAEISILSRLWVLPFFSLRAECIWTVAVVAARVQNFNFNRA